MELLHRPLNWLLRSHLVGSLRARAIPLLASVKREKAQQEPDSALLERGLAMPK